MTTERQKYLLDFADFLISENFTEHEIAILITQISQARKRIDEVRRMKIINEKLEIPEFR